MLDLNQCCLPQQAPKQPAALRGTSPRYCTAARQQIGWMRSRPAAISTWSSRTANDHTAQLTVKRANTGVVPLASPRYELTRKPGSATWRGYSVWFQIAGRLSPGERLDDRPNSSGPMSARSVLF